MNGIYNKFSSYYDELYIRNIQEFINKHKEYNLDDYYVDFYPSFGIKPNERTDFLVVGQAVNGWGSGFCLDENLSTDKISESIHVSNKYLASCNHSPIDWVNVLWSASAYRKFSADKDVAGFYTLGSYKANKSFFWNVTYKLICDYYNLDRSSTDWSKKLVWSNLYKIAPDGKNPDETCQNKQQPLSSELIKQELIELNPKYCIVITGINWWLPFRDILQTQILNCNDEFDVIESLEIFGETKIIVTKRPFIGDSEDFVEQILKAL